MGAALDHGKRDYAKRDLGVNRIGVLHVVDTLEIGGLERAAVNIANFTPRDQFAVHLCTTRHEGPLNAAVAPGVGRLRLERHRTIDLRAIWQMALYIKEHGIRLLHAHGSALFMSRIGAALGWRTEVVWHAHWGRFALEDRPAPWHRLAMRGAGGVIAVNDELAAWSKRRLGVRPDRVWCVPNLVPPASETPLAADLPGNPGSRIICAANIRPEKDHDTLIRAFAKVRRQIPDAHLLLAGSINDAACWDALRAGIAANDLQGHVSYLGSREDILAVMRSCDIGVLSSHSEGLPMALLEYGSVGLAAIATETGQCGEVLAYGHAGPVVPVRDVDKLADALLLVLRSKETRARFGQRFRQRVSECYGPEPVLRQLCGIYRIILGRQCDRPGSRNTRCPHWRSEAAR
jgi:glycosyltransferase involved in cell wall biosynthesis